MRKTEIREIFRNHKPGAEREFNYFSVLVPIVEKQGQLHVLYEVRSQNIASQPGEICFPGGHMENGESPWECALRETWEEIGIPEGCIEVVSQLDTVYTRSNFLMYCYLGIIDEEAVDKAVLNPDEVEEIFTVPLDSLMNNPPDIYINRIIPKPSEDFPYRKVTGGNGYSWREGSETVPVYDIDGRIIWGLTGRITKRFIDLINDSEYRRKDGVQCLK